MTTVYLRPPRGLKTKFQRARRQLRQLKRSFEAFSAANPCTFRREPNQEGTYYLYSLECTEGPDSVQFLADEAIHHLRTWLDHFVTALIEANGRKADGCQFPIWHEEPKTDRARKGFNDCIEGVPDWARHLIIDKQPYKRGETFQGHPLWILNRLDNRFKHTSLHLLAYRVECPNLPGVIHRPAAGVRDFGDVFAEVPAYIDVEKNFEPYIAVRIAFQVSRIGIPNVHIDTLYDIYNFIRDELYTKALTPPYPTKLVY